MRSCGPVPASEGGGGDAERFQRLCGPGARWLAGLSHAWERHRVHSALDGNG